MDAARLTQLALGHWPARAVSAAAEVGVLGLLTEAGPLDAGAIATRLGLRAPSLPDLLDALVGLGVLAADDGRYRLLADVPPELLGLADTDAYRAWAELPAALRDGRRPGATMFEELAADPPRLARFLEAMAAVSAPAHDALVDRVDLSGAATVLDLGGADGRLAVALASANPHLRVTSFDLPALVPHVEAAAAAAGVAERVTAVGGDFLADELPPADAVVLSMVLLDWDTPAKRALLARCAAAVRPGGRLLVLDRLGEAPPSGRGTFDLLRSLHLLVTHGDAFHFTAGELAGWLDEAGFAPPEVVDVGGGFSLAVAVPR